MNLTTKFPALGILLTAAVAIALSISTFNVSAQAAGTQWDTFTVDAANEWAPTGAVTNASSVSVVVAASSGTPFVSINTQFYGFSNPLSGGSVTKTQVGDSVLITDGTFQVLISAKDTYSQPVTLTPLNGSANWVQGNGQIPDGLTINMNLTSFLGEIEFEYSAGAITTNASATSRYIAVVGNTGIQGDYRGQSRSYFNQNSGNSSSTPTSRPAAAKYEGPEILAFDDPRPMVAGGKMTFTGKNLSSVASATIGSVAATLSYDVKTGLTVATPANLAPGKYDLVMQSSYGKLTHINAVTIKAPTPTATIGFRSDAQHLNEKQVLDLVAFNETLNSDYEKVRCIVNASDPKTAKRIADLVCAQVARGEARNVEVIKDLRNTYSGTGFWVRVYAAG